MHHLINVRSHIAAFKFLFQDSSVGGAPGNLISRTLTFELSEKILPRIPGRILSEQIANDGGVLPVILSAPFFLHVQVSNVITTIVPIGEYHFTSVEATGVDTFGEQQYFDIFRYRRIGMIALAVLFEIHAAIEYLETVAEWTWPLFPCLMVSHFVLLPV